MSYTLRKLKYPKLFEQRNLPVSWNTPATNSPKGIYGPVLKFRNSQQLYRPEANIFNSPSLLVRFYPPAHFLSIFRKTKPASNVKTTNSEAYIDKCGPYLNALYNKKKSVIPSSYAVWRRRAKLLVQQAFIEEWTALQGPKGVADTIAANSAQASPDTNDVPYPPAGIAKDGFYEFVILKYPNGPEEDAIISKDVRKAVKKVAELDWDTFLKVRPSRYKTNKKPFNQHKHVIEPTWVQLINEKLKFRQLNTMMRHSSVPYELKPRKLKKVNHPVKKTIDP